MRAVLAFLSRRSRTSIVVLALVLVTLLGVLDYLNGWEISLGAFYMAPVVLVAWYAGGVAAVAMSIICAATWALSNYLAGERFSNPLIPYWNAAVRLGFFLVVTWLAVLLRRSMAELRLALDRAEALAREDVLTGTCNTRAFLERADRELALARRTRRPTTLAYLDLDQFKAINDAFGHATGDRVLRVVGQTLLGTLRTTDIVARLGGDEFAVLLPDTDETAAAGVLAKVRERLTIAMREGGWDVTVSIGSVSTIGGYESTDALVHDADSLMYAAKREGRDMLRHATMDGPRSRMSVD